MVQINHFSLLTVDAENNLRVLTVESPEKGERLSTMSALEYLNKSLLFNNYLQKLIKKQKMGAVGVTGAVYAR